MGIRIQIYDCRFVVEDFKDKASFKKQYSNKMKYYNFHLTQKPTMFEMKHPYLIRGSSIE
jgi:hypothetical protein